MLIPKAEKRIEQIISYIKKHRYREVSKLEFEYYETEETHRYPPNDTGVNWEKIETPYNYGKPWHCSWFRSSFTAPAKSNYPLYLRAVPNADSLVFIDRKPAGAFNPMHRKIKVEADGKKHSLHIEAYAGHYFPGMHPFSNKRVMLTLGRNIDDYPNTFEEAVLAERVEPVYGLFYDTLCLYELAKNLGDNSLRKAKIIGHLYHALMDIDFDGHKKSAGNANSHKKTLLEEEAEKARKKIAPLLDAKNGSTVPEVHLAGHAHIDHAWLWHIGETERKAARTYINMCQLAKEYPEFVFFQSQSAHLEMIKNEYPEIFEAVKEAYKNGNWEANGGMWVEADCNVTGGESLIRQFLVGKRAFNELLGTANEKPERKDVLWLPDVFGYAAALPQILVGCGVTYFITSKINWNDTTRFPYDKFYWRGLYEVGVKTLFITSRKQGYNGRAYPADIFDAWDHVQHKELQSAVIKPIGEGDGGGGTARGDLEMARRMSDLEGLPKANWKKVTAALDEIFGHSYSWESKLPEWKGELYLELHRGTYTTQAALKKYNRKLEYALRNIEFLYTIALLETGKAYPHERLLSNWKKLLTNQFHDIIPGSSIKRVNDEAKETYKEIETDLGDLRDEIIRIFAASSSEKNTGALRVFNDLSWHRDDPVVFPAELLKGVKALRVYMEEKVEPVIVEIGLEDDEDDYDEDDDNKVFPIQRYVDLDGREMAVFCPVLPPLGWNTFVPADFVQKTPLFTFKGEYLSTPFYEVEFEEDGRIMSLFYKDGDRELVGPGGYFNGFITARDVPVLWEAWDIESDWERYYTEETELISTEVSASGPVCFKIRRKYKIGEASQLTQDMVFYAENNRIDFETHINWQEKQKLLKVQFDTAFETDRINCDVQFGSITRNTHKNLPSDRACFEFCAHKWVSLGEPGSGIALFNDCKYGHDAEGGTVRLTLLRSPQAPDEEADIGEHSFNYAVYPYTDDFGNPEIEKKAYEFNIPAKAAATGIPDFADTVLAGNLEYSLFHLSSENIIAETIKAAEPGNQMEVGELIGTGSEKIVAIRLYESLGAGVKCTIAFNQELSWAYNTNMLEQRTRADHLELELEKKGREIDLEFLPFEIKTIVVSFK